MDDQQHQVRAAILRLAGYHDLDLPRYMSDAAAGMDLRAAIERPVTLQPGQRALLGTGIAVALPRGYEGQVRPRSGLAVEHGLTVLNAPGTVDADYRGEIRVLLANLGDGPCTIARGDRVAQLVVVPVARVDWVVCQELPETVRGEGGFGHSGRT